MGRSTFARSLARGVAAGAAAGALVAAGAAWAVAPRRDPGADALWEEVGRHRFAHRGLHDSEAGVPENSLAAFRLARAGGFASELDVRLTADGVPVVVHDADLARVCGVPGTVERLTLRQLGAYRLCGTDERVPTLDEVLDVYDRGLADEPAPPLLVELKVAGNAGALCERTMRALDARDVRYVVESFDPRALAWLRRRRPEVVRGQLTEAFLDDADLSWPMRLGAAACVSTLASDALARPDFVACRISDRDLPAVRLACGRMGAHLALWTVRTPAELAVADELGAPAIFEGFVPDSPLRPEASR